MTKYDGATPTLAELKRQMRLYKIALGYVELKTRAQIAKELGVSAMTIGRDFEQALNEFPPRLCRSVTDNERQTRLYKIAVGYVVRRKTRAQIAKELGLSAMTIGRDWKQALDKFAFHVTFDVESAVEHRTSTTWHVWGDEHQTSTNSPAP